MSATQLGAPPTAVAPVESLCLPARALTMTELLRILDVLRRRLARSTRGREGAFAGFDVLDVAGWQDVADDSAVLFAARLVSSTDAAQVVEYSATRCTHEHGVCRGEGHATPYVQATGATVGLGRPTSTVLPVRFTIAAPHR